MGPSSPQGRLSLLAAALAVWWMLAGASAVRSDAKGPVLSSQSKAVKIRERAADGRIYFGYGQVHEAMEALAEQVAEWKPDVMVAIGGGGFIPARMMRTTLKVPIVAVSLELYDDVTDTERTHVTTKQWLDEHADALVRGKRVLVVDEVDDTRKTLDHCIALLKERNEPGALAVAVVHNKLREKKGTLPRDVAYFAGEHVENAWNCYPWEAAQYGHSIAEHEALARTCNAGVDGA